MVTVCQKCGDGGFTVALIYCDKCQAYAIHRYCLDILPATFEEYVTWFCEDCEPKVAKPSTFDNLSSLPARRSGSDRIETIQATQSGLTQKKKIKNVYFSKKKKNKKKGKDITCSLAKSEVHRPESSGEKAEPAEIKTSLVATNAGSSDEINDHSNISELDYGDRRLNGGNSDREAESQKKNKKKRKVITHSLARSELHRPESSPPIELLEVHCTGNHKKDHREPGRASSGEKAESAKANTSLVTTNDLSNIPKDNSFVPEERGLNVGSSDEEVKTKTSLVVTNHHSNIPELEYGDRQLHMGNSDKEAESCGIKTSVAGTNDQFKFSGCSSYVPAQPIIEPIWRGCFSLCHENFGTIGGLVAHLSSLACQKVYDAARLLPKSLCPELLPRSDIWPKGFGKWGPSDDSIALYFFPNNERVEKVFDSLVDEIIQKDLAMRAMVENVELLLFTSVQLPIELWRFQCKFYLWGVFKGKQASSHLQAVVPGEEKGNPKASNWNSRSHFSPLSNCGSKGSGSMYSPFRTSVA